MHLCSFLCYVPWGTHAYFSRVYTQERACQIKRCACLSYTLENNASLSWWIVPIHILLRCTRILIFGFCWISFSVNCFYKDFFLAIFLFGGFTFAYWCVGIFLYILDISTLSVQGAEFLLGRMLTILIRIYWFFSARELQSVAFHTSAISLLLSLLLLEWPLCAQMSVSRMQMLCGIECFSFLYRILFSPAPVIPLLIISLYLSLVITLALLPFLEVASQYFQIHRLLVI